MNGRQRGSGEEDMGGRDSIPSLARLTPAARAPRRRGTRARHWRGRARARDGERPTPPKQHRGFGVWVDKGRQPGSGGGSGGSRERGSEADRPGEVGKEEGFRG
ncbi:unnamed protein product, partial [Urochloa humidicola]